MSTHVTAADLDAWAAESPRVPRCGECGDVLPRHFRCCSQHDPRDVS